MAKNKSEQHHWWPVCLSQHWRGADGGVTWLKPDGSEKRIRPKNLGAIGNGHFIKLAPGISETVWDQNFEDEFRSADANFPAVISFLESLNLPDRSDLPKEQRFSPAPIPEAIFDYLLEGLISLAVRSPMTREAVVRLAEQIRGPLPEKERNSLIALNLRDMHKNALRAMRGRGKMTAISSSSREFIFGDGFYHNLTSPAAPPMSARILAPLTPRIAVLYAIPMSYNPEPRLSTLVLSAEEAEMLNSTVQIYARRAIFYRSERPTIMDDFSCGSHRCYRALQDPIAAIIESMPGV